MFSALPTELARWQKRDRRRVRKVAYHARGAQRLQDLPPSASAGGSSQSGWTAPPSAAEPGRLNPTPERGPAGGTAQGGILPGEDAPAGRNRPARDGGQHGGRVQPQDLQPGGKSNLNVWTLPWRVLHHLQQAREARPARHGDPPLLLWRSP